MGAGSVFLNTDFSRYILADINSDLISLYNIVKLRTDEYVAEARKLFTPENNNPDVYYQFRAEFNQSQDPFRRALLFLYLNRHGYNGLCRYNLRGEFNVPFGRYKRPYFPQDELYHFAEKAQNAEFHCLSYEECMELAGVNSVVYCDPPYAPLSATANFTAYHTNSFSPAEQARLAEMAEKLVSKRIPVFLIAPSILSADFARLGEDTANALAAGADVVHFDVMDNHYVPNLTIGPMVLKALRNYGITAPIDVHLMVKPVDRIVPDFAAAGASIITFHPEASEHVDRTLQLIKENGCKAGLVFNPATPLSYLDYVMDKLDVILLMSVNPGFGGQSFIPHTLDKLREVRRRIDESGYDIRLEVDGGVKVNNIGEIAAAGADMFVAGSAIFDQPDYKKVIDEMRRELAKVSHG